MRKDICEHCGKQLAEVFYQENRNGKVKEMSLCGDCAKKLGVTGHFAQEDLFASFPLFSGITREIKKEKSCPVCGKSLSHIQKSGKFGCSVCYDTFGEALDFSPFVGTGYQGEPLTKPRKKEEPKTEETGKAESTEALRKELKRAVAEENYEKAAQLRDEIRAREAQ